ncbi:MAG: alanine--tRNA ligase [Holosporaceae bacterium]|nr:alanine--tRNA ligase [Holosporaceae bacterium]
MLVSDIRREFLNFFESNGHRVVESSSLAPHNDPSLLFTNAGMVQFKNVFTGLENRDYRRAASSQKCLRAGGKHNDLDQVGFTARHHTFFEMLGNFSFGDYFKEEALDFAWTFLTKELALPRERLLATVFHTDEEAKSIWKKIAGDMLVIPIATSDNFWSMGDVGPCGPCSEIFYDLGNDVPGGLPGTANGDGDRYMEIWNIVFMQFEQLENGERVALRRQSIDTGMGLERIAAVMQGKKDNYLIDLFQTIIDQIKTISKTSYADTFPSYKVIADHIRSVSFLMADGVAPSNEGRGYVLRRILRRAIRHGHLVGLKEPFLFKLAGTLVDVMGQTYPELEKARELVASTIRQEEENFLETLERGLKILQSDVKSISVGGVLDGAKAFKLYDTYGFPLDLTQDILRSEGISVDVVGFELALQEQRSRGRWTGSGDVKEEAVWHSLREKLKPTAFLGYDKEGSTGRLLAIVQDGSEIPFVSSGKAFFITESTPFYAESGGQCGDVGIISSPNGSFRVTNTRKFCDSIVGHEGNVISGSFRVSDEASLRIDGDRRQKIKVNHTSTHLLQAALRSVLGNHVVQRGASLNDERLRLDFSHSSAIVRKDLLKIEKIVNGWIRENLPVACRDMPKNDAIAAGAMALFGEKYGDMVRTVLVERSGEAVSFELCGGTHISSTGEIGSFKILTEASIGSGIRRIEAITGANVSKYLTEMDDALLEISDKLKCGRSEVLPKINELLTELKRKNQEIFAIKQKNAQEKMQVFHRDGVDIHLMVVADYNIEELRSLNDAVRRQKPSGIIAALSQNGDRVLVTVSVNIELQDKCAAAQILKTILAPLNGKGGGGAAFAQGSGSGTPQILSIVEQIFSMMRP